MQWIPSDARAFIDMENGFRSKSRKQALKGHIGAIDGIHFPLKRPEKHMLNSNRCFMRRKDKFALLRIACCDSNRNFTSFSLLEIIKEP